MKCLYGKKKHMFSSTNRSMRDVMDIQENKRTSLLHSAITYEWKSSIYFLCHVLRSRKVLLSSNSRCLGCKKNPLIARMWFIPFVCCTFFFHLDLNFFLEIFLWFIGALNRLCFIRQNRLNFISTFTFIFLHFKFTNLKFVSYWVNGDFRRI